MPVIEVEHLRKHYGDVHAVEDVSFSVERGEIFGILGRNGAGKTTTVSSSSTSSSARPRWPAARPASPTPAGSQR